MARILMANSAKPTMMADTRKELRWEVRNRITPSRPSDRALMKTTRNSPPNACPAKRIASKSGVNEARSSSSLKTARPLARWPQTSGFRAGNEASKKPNASRNSGQTNLAKEPMAGAGESVADATGSELGIMVGRRSLEKAAGRRESSTASAVALFRTFSCGFAPLGKEPERRAEINPPEMHFVP